MFIEVFNIYLQDFNLYSHQVTSEREFSYQNLFTELNKYFFDRSEKKY